MSISRSPSPSLTSMLLSEKRTSSSGSPKPGQLSANSDDVPMRNWWETSSSQNSSQQESRELPMSQNSEESSRSDGFWQSQGSSQPISDTWQSQGSSSQQPITDSQDSALRSIINPFDFCNTDNPKVNEAQRTIERLSEQLKKLDGHYNTSFFTDSFHEATEGNSSKKTHKTAANITQEGIDSLVAAREAANLHGVQLNEHVGARLLQDESGHLVSNAIRKFFGNLPDSKTYLINYPCDEKYPSYFQRSTAPSTIKHFYLITSSDSSDKCLVMPFGVTNDSGEVSLRTAFEIPKSPDILQKIYKHKGKSINTLQLAKDRFPDLVSFLKLNNSNGELER